MDISKNTEGAKSPSKHDLQDVVTEYYGDEVWRALKAGLGVVCSLAMKGRGMPLTLIYEGPSGTGKSTCINMLTPDRDATKTVLYRLDSFTAKSFVTHAANVPLDDLKEIDLLPKLNNKVMVTKELAPMFRGNETELRERFAMLAAILDGKGYQSASGVHGTRGYTEEIIFNWIGGTTPIPTKTDNVMAQLGNRMLRYEFHGAQYTAEDIAAYLDDQSQDAHERECRTMANDYLEAFFRESPPGSISQEEVPVSDEMRLEMGRLAMLIAHGRVEIAELETPVQGEPEFVAGSPEGPHRVALLLRQLAQGLALASGRTKVTWEDMNAVRHVAFSSIPAERRKVLRLFEGGPELTSKAVQEKLAASRPTAQRYMKILAATGISTLEKGSGNEPSVISLAEEWRWLPIQEAVLAQPKRN